jgi:hypothetical protein
MPELTLPFWLESTVLPESETINDWLKTCRVQPRWIDEVIRVSTDTAAPSPVALDGLEPSTLQLEWPLGWNSEHSLLQAACREISVGDRRLILLLAQQTAVLLAAPAVIGMYNLMPLAYVDELFSVHMPAPEMALLDFLDALLQKKQRKSSQVNQLLLVQHDAKRPVKTNTGFEGAGWVKSQLPGGALTAAHELVQSLAQKKQVNGLAVEVGAEQNLFATWIERV